MNTLIQNILVIVTIAIATVYLVNKFLLPAKYKIFGKKKSAGCGQGDCGCH
ncbi:FeoB-associated Cys-rich membrane protein [Robertkochia sediminum]|uniref:FeoB-associated Cys-rich membrane protein n=1 Tax=Robertkochia sediminum TaxID=2785326 RepID=UPI001933F423|nr:FeoB-associated Cys-rich membrane protein [Robertkochia sediminum]MBL7473797.1 FeoB-associated Cys-rich membrane protein [Robertkochia sediminum]